MHQVWRPKDRQPGATQTARATESVGVPGVVAFEAFEENGIGQHAGVFVFPLKLVTWSFFLLLPSGSFWSVFGPFVFGRKNHLRVDFHSRVCSDKLIGPQINLISRCQVNFFQSIYNQWPFAIQFCWAPSLEQVQASAIRLEESLRRGSPAVPVTFVRFRPLKSRLLNFNQCQSLVTNWTLSQFTCDTVDHKKAFMKAESHGSDFFPLKDLIFDDFWWIIQTSYHLVISFFCLFFFSV
jgi:hypothetical protein